MKKLEPGCKAMVIRCSDSPELVGLIIKIVKFHKKERIFRGDKVGYVIENVWESDFKRETYDGSLWAESCLMRIDDDANLEDIKTQREKSWSQ